MVSPFKVTSALVAAGRQKQHTVLGGLLCHGQRDRGEEAADDGLGRIRHDLVVGIHRLLGVLGIVSDLTAVDDFDLIAGVPPLISSTAISMAFCAPSP